MRKRSTALVMSLMVAAWVGASAPAAAGSAQTSAKFQLGEWITLDAKDGPVTLHRIRVADAGRGVTKSLLSRPGNSEYLDDVEIQLEFSNDATRDWEAKLEVEWVDGDGKAIDGYNDTEGLDSESRSDVQTVRLSTLRYGLDRAKKLNVKVEFYPD